MKHTYNSKKSKTVLQATIVILAFLLAVYGNRILQQFVQIRIDEPVLRLIYSYSWWVLPIIVVTGGLFGYNKVLKELCLDKGLFVALVFGLITVSPMLISSAVIGEIEMPIDWLDLLRSTLFAGFMEELLFRGFLFGLLFRKLHWGFIPASVLGALIFGMGHLYQGTNSLELIGIFFVTFIGSAWFAWLFIEWKENLWIPIVLHILMNLSWSLFDVGNNALGDTYTNIFRIVTIVLTILATVYFNLRMDQFSINGKNLLIHRSTDEDILEPTAKVNDK